MAGNVLTFLIFGVFANIAQANEIPVVVWTSDESVHYPVSLAGHTLDSDSFYNGYLQQLLEKDIQNVAVFVQDQLSVDDITRYGDVFNDKSSGAAYQSLRKIMETYEATFIPSVKEPVNAIDKLLERFQGQAVFVDNADDLENLNLNSDSSNFVIVTLPKTTSGRKLEALVEIDSMINKLSQKMSALNHPFHAVYTAKAKSRQYVENNIFKGRHLLETNDSTNYTFFNQSNCMYMYFNQMQLNIVKLKGINVGQKFTLPPIGSILINGSCVNGSATVSYEYTENLPTNLNKFSMVITLSTHMRYWFIKDWNITFSGSAGTDTDLKPFNGTNVALERYTDTIFGIVPWTLTSDSGRSYHCGNPEPIKQHDRGDHKPDVVHLLFTNLQLQYNITGATNYTFSDADDCIGFFSEVIWMSLIVTLVLVLILSFGIAMLANINTMDRFDDPKGKSIQVNTVE